MPEPRRILVTGASGGIGGATVEAFAVAGDHVIATGRSEAHLKALRGRCAGGAVETMAGDLTDPVFVDRLVGHAEPIDVLVNAAGWARHAPFLDNDPADWQKSWEINVQALLVLSQAVARGMTRRRSGHIINISSVLADRVYPYTLFYAATKHAVRAISRGLRIELAASGIKVTEVAPGLVDTGLLGEVDHPAVIAAYAARKHPPLQPADIADTIVAATRAAPNACPELIALNPMGQTT